MGRWRWRALVLCRWVSLGKTILSLDEDGNPIVVSRYSVAAGIPPVRKLFEDTQTGAGRHGSE